MDRRTAGLTALLCTPGLVWTLDLLASTPPLILFAATVPAAALATAVVLAQRRIPRLAAVTALAWGAFGAAFLASVTNGAARDVLTSAFPQQARGLTAALLAPVLEEAAKAIGLLLIATPGRKPVHARAAVIAGALVGVGFVWTENFLYLGVAMLQGGEAGLWTGVYMRGVLGAAAHVTFTASAGAALAHAASRCSLGMSWSIAVAVAALQHGAWNVAASPLLLRILCDGSAADCRLDTPAVAVSAAVALLFLLPGIIGVRAGWTAR